MYGLPLRAIALGPDWKKGELRGHARAIFASGDMAPGWFAYGGFARGIFTFGGLAIGCGARPVNTRKDAKMNPGIHP